jgi:hypothetical protein
MIIGKLNRVIAFSPFSDPSSSLPSSPRSGVLSLGSPRSVQTFRDPKSPSDSREISQMHYDKNLDTIAKVILKYLKASDEDKKIIKQKEHSNPEKLIHKINSYNPSDIIILKDKLNKFIQKSQEHKTTKGELIASFEKILDDIVETTREQSSQLRENATLSLALSRGKDYLLDSIVSSPGSSPAKRLSSLGSSPAKGSSSLGSSHSQSARSPAPIKSLFPKSGQTKLI